MVNLRKEEKSKLSTSDHSNACKKKKKKKVLVSHDGALGSSHSHFKNQPKSSSLLFKY